MFPHEVVLNAAKVDPHVRQLMEEERPAIKKLVAVKLLPLVSACPFTVTLRGHRVGRRCECEDVKNQRFVVSEPTILDEAAFWSPSMRDRDSAVQRPLPVGAAVDGVGK